MDLDFFILHLIIVDSFYIHRKIRHFVSIKKLCCSNDRSKQVWFSLCTIACCLLINNWIFPKSLIMYYLKYKCQITLSKNGSCCLARWFAFILAASPMSYYIQLMRFKFLCFVVESYGISNYTVIVIQIQCNEEVAIQG